jgi:hypothetical protein
MVKSVEVRRKESKRVALPMPLACMRTIGEINKQGVPPRHVLMAQEIEHCKKKGLTLVIRSLPDEYKPKDID